MAAGTPMMTKTAASRQYRLVCSASSTQPKIRLPAMPVSGVHHQMARMTGQAATIPAVIAAMTVPQDQPGEQGEERLPFAGGHGGGQGSRDDKDDVEHDLGLAEVGPHDRLLDDRDRAIATAKHAAVR